MKWILPVVLLACGRPPTPASRGAGAAYPPPPLVPSPAAPAAPALRPPDVTPLAKAEEIVLRHCVLHAGHGTVTVVNGRRQGECSFNAECFEKRGGSAAATDGFVAVRCEGRDCVCTRATASPERQETRDFELDGDCLSAEQARAVLVKECIRTDEMNN